MARHFVSVLFLLLLSTQAHAGWYHVENYEGAVGPDSIHLSLQTYDGFGSGITVQGSYFYDAKRSPVALYGKTTDGKLELCAIANDEEFYRIIVMGSKTPFDTSRCPLSQTLDDNGATGSWRKDGQMQPVSLKKVATLDDTGEAQISGTVEIPFWAQTATHMFSGLYASADTGICMQTLQIIDKNSNKVDQQIDFDNNDCNAGMLMTPIYMNVERQADGDMILVNIRDGQAGDSMDYSFNPATRRYDPAK